MNIRLRSDESQSKLTEKHLRQSSSLLKAAQKVDRQPFSQVKLKNAREDSSGKSHGGARNNNHRDYGGGSQVTLLQKQQLQHHSMSQQQLIVGQDLPKHRIYPAGAGTTIGGGGINDEPMIYSKGDQSMMMLSSQQQYLQNQQHHQSQGDAQLYAPSSQAVVMQMLNKQQKQTQPSQRRKKTTSQRSNRGGAATSSTSTNNLNNMPEPAYTSDQAKARVESGRLQYPDDPSKYRRINPQMDQELVWYRTEIEKRFKTSTMRDYVFQRSLETRATNANQHVSVLASIQVTSGGHLTDLRASKEYEDDKNISNVLSRSSSDSRPIARRFDKDYVAKGMNDLVKFDTGQDDSCLVANSSGNQSGLDYRSKNEATSSQIQIKMSQRFTEPQTQARKIENSLQGASGRSNIKKTTIGDDFDDHVDSRQSLIKEEGTTYYKQAASHGGASSNPFMTHHEVKVDSYVGKNDRAQQDHIHHQKMTQPSPPPKEKILHKAIDFKGVSLTSEKTIPSGGRRQVSCTSYDEQKKPGASHKLTASFSKVEIKKSVSSQSKHLVQDMKKFGDVNNRAEMMPGGYGHSRNQRSQTYNKKIDDAAQEASQRLMEMRTPGHAQKSLKQRDHQQTINDKRVLARKSPNHNYAQNLQHKSAQKKTTLKMEDCVVYLIGKEKRDANNLSITHAQRSVLSTKSIQSQAKKYTAQHSLDSQSHHARQSLSNQNHCKKSQRSSSNGRALPSSRGKSGSVSRYAVKRQKSQEDSIKDSRIDSSYRGGKQDRKLAAQGGQQLSVSDCQSKGQQYLITATTNSQKKLIETDVPSLNKKTRNGHNRMHKSQYELFKVNTQIQVDKAQKQQQSMVGGNSLSSSFAYPSISLKDQVEIIRNSLNQSQNNQDDNSRAQTKLKGSQPQKQLKKIPTKTSLHRNDQQRGGTSSSIDKVLTSQIYNQHHSSKAEQSRNKLPNTQTQISIQTQPTLNVFVPNLKYQIAFANSSVADDSFNNQLEIIDTSSRLIEKEEDQSEATNRKRFGSKVAQVTQKQAGKDSSRQAKNSVRRKKQQKKQQSQLAARHVTSQSQERVSIQASKATSNLHTQPNAKLPRSQMKRNKAIYSMATNQSFSGQADVGNFVAQAYDSGSILQGTAGKDDVIDSIQGKLSQSRNAQRHHKTFVSASRMNSSMDYSISMKMSSPKLASMIQLMQTGQSRAHSKVSGNSGKSAQKKNVMARQSFQQHDRNGSFYDEGGSNLANEDDFRHHQRSVLQTSGSKNRQSLNISIQNLQSGSKVGLGPLIGVEPSLSESMQILPSSDMSSHDMAGKAPAIVSKKPRQAQSFIDLEAIKKSINKKMAQSQYDEKQDQKVLAAAVSAHQLNLQKMVHGQGLGLGGYLPYKQASYSGSGALMLEPQQTKLSTQSQMVNSMSQVSMRRLQEQYKNQQLLKKTRKQRNQGLILNKSQVNQAENSSIAMGGTSMKGGDARNNDSFSLGHDNSLVLTATRSKNFRPNDSTVSQAYQTPASQLQQAQPLLSQSFSHQKMSSVSNTYGGGNISGGGSLTGPKLQRASSTINDQKRKSNGSISSTKKVIQQTYAMIPGKKPSQNHGGSSSQLMQAAPKRHGHLSHQMTSYF